MALFITLTLGYFATLILTAIIYDRIESEFVKRRLRRDQIDRRLRALIATHH